MEASYLGTGQNWLTKNGSSDAPNHVFEMAELVNIILNNNRIPVYSSLSMVNKKLYSTIHEDVNLYKNLLAEQATVDALKSAKKDLNSIQQTQSETAWVEVNSLEAIIDLARATDDLIQKQNHSKSKLEGIYCDVDSQSIAWIHVIAQVLKLGNLSLAKELTRKIQHPYYQSKAWLEIWQHEPCEYNINQAQEAAKKIIGNQAYKARFLAFYEIWKHDPDNEIVKKACNCLVRLKGLEEEDKLKEIYSMLKAESAEPFLVWFNNQFIWAKEEPQSLKDAKVKADALNNPAEKFKAWVAICNLETTKENFEKMIKICKGRNHPEEWAQVYQLVSSKDHADEIKRLAMLQKESEKWASVLLLVVKKEIEQGNITEAKNTAESISNVKNRAEAWIEIWKSDLTKENFRRVKSAIREVDGPETRCILWAKIGELFMDGK